VHLPIVEVCANGCLNVPAFLDSGSSSTFCTKELAGQLGLHGRVTKYHLSTLGKSEEVSSEVVNFSVSSLDGEQHLKLSNVYVVDQIPVRIPHIDTRKYKHLQDIQICQGGGAVSILIGQDNAEALVHFEVRMGQRGEPIATKTLLGWALNGPARMFHNVNSRVISHFISANLSVNDQIHALWNIENEGICTDECSWSNEDRQVIDLWNEKCRFNEGHYELPIPWRPHVEMPNNVSLAMSRLMSTKRSLLKRDLWVQYNEEMNKLLVKGYAEIVPNVNSSDRIWYLPHHAVVTDKKPGKLRIVFDCAAKYEGESLNDKCWSGPDQNNKLLDVILRFREHSLAVTADIESMYYQVVVPVEDRDALRFLWFDPAGNVVHYRMTRHLFGGIWCSSSSTYALRRVLEDHEVDPLVCDTVKHAFYVDDCLKSVATREEVEIVVNDTKELLAKGGFNLTKFVVNDPDLLELIPSAERASEVKDLGSCSSSRALGVRWNVECDTFFFEIDVCPEKVITRREILKVVASVFDPLGLVNPVVVTGKIILQEATRSKLTWDEKVPREIESKWLVWLQDLHDVSVLKVARCIKPNRFDEAVAELHHFSDASQSAYGCCSYLRLVNAQGQIHTALVMSKVKVAPIRSITIPRLELQAAVLAVKVDVTLRKQLGLDLNPSYFWVDSEIVLKYINNENRRFLVFVGNRVSMIRESTEVDQWHFVSGKENPADLLTRGQRPHELDADTWFKGPKFLQTFKSEWKAMSCDLSMSGDDPEVKKDPKNVCCATAVFEDPLEKLSNHYSSWYKLKRGTAWLLRFVKCLKQRQRISGDLTVLELRQAESVLLKHVQSVHYNEEVNDLSHGKVVNKSSPLRSLDPFLDQDGVLRVGGRFRQSRSVEFQPAIVSHKHVVSKLLATEFHAVAHCGVEWVTSEIRRKYWITKIRVVVKSVIRNCFMCKRLFGRPGDQKMSNLPQERLISGNPPFTYTGIDCFGPFLIKNGRSEVKRYCCLFTCLNTRAVHLEKINSMDTDSFLNAFNRFVARRNCPKKVWSDNGTNFVGGRAEMIKNAQSQIHKHVVRKHIEWHFNPPGASHMGGIWERVIRTVRKVLLGLIGNHCRMSDEGLATLFCEVECIINSRPITKVSDDIRDSTPLTPNHLLLLAECPSLPPGVFTETDIYRRRWRCIQHFANVFWCQWLKQYLPELQKRTKWCQPKRNFKVGDLVLITDENTPRGVWPMGLIVEVHESADGFVRSVKIKTKSSCLQRPITKIVLLEGDML
jgi:transposase InsO family protein